MLQNINCNWSNLLLFPTVAWGKVKQDMVNVIFVGFQTSEKSLFVNNIRKLVRLDSGNFEEVTRLFSGPTSASRLFYT
jgi:hypothetical protein